MDQAQQLRNIVNAKKQNERHARVITVTSGKGGVGKSNTCVNLAVQLQRMGKSVIIVDADFGLANVEVMFGALPKYNLGDLIFRGKSIQEIITKGPEGIGFISGGSGVVGLNKLKKEQLAYLIHNLSFLEQMADIIIIDTGAGISDTVVELALSSPEVIVVTTPEPSSLTDSYAILKALIRNPKYNQDTVIRVLANKVSSVEDGEAVCSKLSSVVNKFLDAKFKFLGMVPADPMIDKAIRQQKPVSIIYPNSKSAKAYEIIADNLLNDVCNKPTVQKGIAELLTGFITRRV